MYIFYYVFKKPHLWVFYLTSYIALLPVFHLNEEEKNPIYIFNPRLKFIDVSVRSV